MEQDTRTGISLGGDSLRLKRRTQRMVRIKKRPLKVWVRPDGKIPAAVYLRASSPGQDVENSVDAQLERINRWAEEHGYVIVQVFTDRAKTGRLANRPDFQEMIGIAEGEDCPFSVVLVWRFSRFFRDRVESGIHKNRLRKRNIRVISINEPVDDTPAGQLQEGVIELFDQYSSDVISEDVQRGTHRLAERGFFVGATAPTGMEKIKVLDEQGQRVTERHKLAPGKDWWMIRRIFDLSLQEKTDNQIQRILKKEGIRKPGGKPWSSNRIHDVLTNRHYEGTIVWGRRPDGTWETVCEGAHEGIVTPEEFNKVQELRRERSPEVTHPKHAGSEHMLSKLGLCRQCGEPYNYRPSGSKGKRYESIICKTRRDFGPKVCDSPILPAPAFEAMTLDVVEKDILLHENLETAIDQMRKNSGALHSDKNEQISRIQENIVSLDRRIEKVYFAWESEDIPYELFKTRSEALRENKAQAMAELAKAEEDLDDTHVILAAPGKVLSYAAELKTFLREQNPARTRTWLKKFLVRYWVEPGCVTYEYRLPLPPGSANAGLKKHGVPLDEKLRPITRSGPRRRESKPRRPLIASPDSERCRVKANPFRTRIQ